MLFSSLYEILHSKNKKVLTCSNLVLSIIVLLMMETHPLNAIILDFSGDNSIQNYFVVLCQVYNSLCKASSMSDKSTWSSANNNVLCYHLFQFQYFNTI